MILKKLFDPDAAPSIVLEERVVLGDRRDGAVYDYDERTILAVNVLPLDDYLAELRAHGFAGTLTFEPFGNGSYALDPVSVWRRSLDAIAPHFERAGQA